jgi:hypothetical protein
MIEHINASGHIIISGASSSGPYISNYNNQPMVGMVRYHNSTLEVYDGSVWHKIGGGSYTFDLSGNANSAINWAINKMNQEVELEKLAADHPAMKAAYENLQRARQQLEATAILVKEEYNNEQSTT